MAGGSFAGGAVLAGSAASAALIDAVGETGVLQFDSDPLRRDAQLLRHRLDELVAANPEHVTMVRQLEQAFDVVDPSGGVQISGEALSANDLVSGDELAAELERFLREQGG